VKALILDSEAFSQLARTNAKRGVQPIREMVIAAFEEDIDVIVPAAVLAEQYRGGHHDQVVDSCLGQFGGVYVMNTTRELARKVGHILAAAGRGSEDHVDATVVASAIEVGGAVILTGDPEDLNALSERQAGVFVQPL
jgi:hypothetical protein